MLPDNTIPVERLRLDNLTRERVSQLFAAMSHPTRLRIVELLSEGPRSVTDIADKLQVGQSGISQHLAILTRAGVLAVEPVGVVRLYRVRGPRIVKILNLIEEFCTVHNLYGRAEDEPLAPQ